MTRQFEHHAMKIRLFQSDNRHVDCMNYGHEEPRRVESIQNQEYWLERYLIERYQKTESSCDTHRLAGICLLVTCVYAIMKQGWLMNRFRPLRCDTHMLDCTQYDTCTM